MSSANQQKKKQDERNSKLIRDLASLPANKYCFECSQRGPTYINITHGSFCCMHCSGLLRGLNPPHRVKSISMATFSNEEVEKLKSMGNEENAKIWLGLLDVPIKFEPVRLDENVKQHLIQKYERKKWFVSPTEIAEQKRLLEAHSRRDSTSAISINSHKSNQSAPANLQPEKKSDLMDILGGDFMFPVKEEPANITPSLPASSTFSSSLHSTAPPSFPPPPFASNFPLTSHSNTPQPLQFDFFGAPPSAAKVSSPPATMRQPSQQNNAFDLFGPPPTAPQQQQPKIQDNFANFDAVFNSFSISDKPVAPVQPLPSQPVQSQQFSNGFLSSTPSMQPMLQPVVQSQPFSTAIKPEEKMPGKKDDGMPDYSALEALYKAEDEPVDFFGFGKTNTNTNSHNAASVASNGFAKSSTVGDFAPTSHNFVSPNTSLSTSGLTSNSFFSMNSFQPTAFSTPKQSTATTPPWLPSTSTTASSNGTTTAASTNGQWNPFS